MTENDRVVIDGMSWSLAPGAPLRDESGRVIGDVVSVEATGRGGFLITTRMNADVPPCVLQEALGRPSIGFSVEGRVVPRRRRRSRWRRFWSWVRRWWRRFWPWLPAVATLALALALALS